MGAAAGFAQKTQPRHTTAPRGVYRPRRPQASPLYRLIEDRFDEFSTVYDERFARRWGYWRKVVGEVVGDCRVQSAECRIAVPPRFVCSTVLQSAICNLHFAFRYFLYDRKLLGELSRVAARTVTSFIRATVGEIDL